MYLTRFASLGPQISVKTQDGNLSEVSQIQIIFINKQNVDFEKTPIYINFIPKNNKQVNILGKSIVGDQGLEQGISEYNSNKISANKGALQVSFSIAVINRNPERGEEPRATFLIEGANVPDFRITTTQPGLKIRKYYSDNYKPMLSTGQWLIVLYLATLIIVFIVSNYRRISSIKSSRKEEVLRVKQYIISNKSDLSAGNDLRKYAKDMYVTSLTNDFGGMLYLYEDYIKENLESFRECSDKQAEQLAKILLIKEFNEYLGSRPFWRKIFFPTPTPSDEDLS